MGMFDGHCAVTRTNIQANELVYWVYVEDPKMRDTYKLNQVLFLRERAKANGEEVQSLSEVGIHLDEGTYDMYGRLSHMVGDLDEPDCRTDLFMVAHDVASKLAGKKDLLTEEGLRAFIKSCDYARVQVFNFCYGSQFIDEECLEIQRQVATLTRGRVNNQLKQVEQHG